MLSVHVHSAYIPSVSDLEKQRCQLGTSSICLYDDPTTVESGATDQARVFFLPYFCFDTHSLSHFAKNMHICIDHLRLRLWIEEEAGRGVSAQLEWMQAYLSGVDNVTVTLDLL